MNLQIGCKFTNDKGTLHRSHIEPLMQKTENRKEKTENRKKKTENRKQKTVKFRFLFKN